MKIDLTEVQKRVDDGLISMREHPELDLWVLNYTPRVQYDRKWDDYTTRCRGMIVDREGNVIGNSFPKFFNLGETEATKPENLPAEMPKISEKLDGSLITACFYNGELVIASRGSFESPQAIWAKGWFEAHRAVCDAMLRTHTYCYEAVYPENRNVVQYGNREECVLLAVRNAMTGEEIGHIAEAARIGVTAAKLYDFKSVGDAMKALDEVAGTEQEGFVAYYPSTGFRLKMKGEDYFRLHKLLHQTSTVSIWEELSSTGTIDVIIEEMPDELYDWVRKTEKELRAQYKEIVAAATETFEEAKKKATRKEQALYIKEHCSAYSGVCFNLLDGRQEDAEQVAWRLVKPTWKPFKSEVWEEL